MPVLVDISQITIANLMVSLQNHHNAELNEDILRHMVLNSLRKNRQRFLHEYGELVICVDDRGNWRKEVFPYYKANRIEAKADSELDWNLIHDAISKIMDELEEHMPYKVIKVPGAEADDVIATIIHDNGTPVGNGGEQFLIMSGDKDFKQLHIYTNVSQYTPILDGRWITCDDPDRYLVEQILKGDSGDGVPNVRSQDDHFIAKPGRQKPISTKIIQSYPDGVPENWGDISKNVERNREMVDLSRTPKHIKSQILAKYNSEGKKSRKKILPYFADNKLRKLMEQIQEF